MTDTEKNKLLGDQFFRALSNGDVPGVLDMLGDEASWTVCGKFEGVSGCLARAQVGPMLEGTKGLYKSPGLRITPTVMVAEGDRLAVEAEGYAELVDGRIYSPSYFFLLLIRNGKILEVKEFLDTLYAKEMFFPG